MEKELFGQKDITSVQLEQTKSAIQKYIREQENEDMIADQLSFKEYEDPFAHLKK